MFYSTPTARPTKSSFINIDEVVYDCEDKLLILAVIEYALFDYRRAFDMPSKQNITVAKAAHAWLNAKYNPGIECSLAFWCDLLFANPEGVYERIQAMARKHPPTYSDEAFIAFQEKGGKQVTTKAKTYTRSSANKTGRPPKTSAITHPEVLIHTNEGVRTMQLLQPANAAELVRQQRIKGEDCRHFHRQLASPRAVINKHRRLRLVK